MPEIQRRPFRPHEPTGTDRDHHIHEREKGRVKDARTQAEIESALSDPETRAILNAAPHPNDYRAQKGDSLLDWCEWMIDHAGVKGRKAIATAIRAAIEP